MCHIPIFVLSEPIKRLGPSAFAWFKPTVPPTAKAALSRRSSMARGSINGMQNGVTHTIRFIPLSYDGQDSEGSALRLVLALRPEWRGPASKVGFVRFTDGITNTLLKAENEREGLSKEETDGEAILLRAYGQGTDVIIDRQRETQNHELLMKHGLAPELLARFNNGMMYRFIRGSVAHPEDLRKPSIYRAVACRLAQWHAIVPCIPGKTGHSRKSSRSDGFIPSGEQEYQMALDNAAPGKPSPNVWTVMQKWIFALPTETEAQRQRQADLQKELGSLIGQLSQRPGLGKNGVSHCTPQTCCNTGQSLLERSSSLRTAIFFAGTLLCSRRPTG